jgi:formate hydrogenlyase subunit 5
MESLLVPARSTQPPSGRTPQQRAPPGMRYEIDCEPQLLPEICGRLTGAYGFSFAGLVVEQQPPEWGLRYLFYAPSGAAFARPEPCRLSAPPSAGELAAIATGASWIHLVVRQPLARLAYPSISAEVHAADWHEREVEDLFELTFEGHPRLGDFVLHDDAWQEGLAPMRKEFDARSPPPERRPNTAWRPHRIVHEPGVFGMPIGPVYGGICESMHFLLETVGEDVIRALPRLFYKYRAVEKIAEGRPAEDLLLLAERFNGIAAFAHGLACAQAIEAITSIEPPVRARVLRVILAELERLRHHTGAIHDICESTSLTVAASQAAILEEELLRLSGELTGHRYLFGLLAAGGLTRNFEDDSVRAMMHRALEIAHRLDRLERYLVKTSSFLDRLEEVGIITLSEARTYGLVGPIARASGFARDLRHAQPYADYGACAFDIPQEQEGDGYARLRMLFAEARQSARIMQQAVAVLPGGPVRQASCEIPPGAALGWTEAPLGATFHWVRTDERGLVSRYHIMPPSFVNWHGFHLAAERFAFQDFPIILATLGLSVAESDR